jgi:hypothetical protein
MTSSANETWRDADLVGWGSAEGIPQVSDGGSRTDASGPRPGCCGTKGQHHKPLKGLGSGVFEIALRYRSDAFRVVYGVQLAEAIWVIHAFQKKAKRGIATPMEEIELIRQRLRRLREQLR